MTQPALTIASLLSDPRLVKGATSWLKGERYRLEDLGSLSDPIAELLQRRDAFDVVLLQQGVTAAEALEALRQHGLLLPAVVVGEVNGRVDYHDAEVHLPQDQLEQIVYSLDAAVSRFLRKGLSAGQEPGVVHLDATAVAAPQSATGASGVSGRLLQTRSIPVLAQSPQGRPRGVAPVVAAGLPGCPDQLLQGPRGGQSGD